MLCMLVIWTINRFENLCVIRKHIYIRNYIIRKIVYV